MDGSQRGGGAGLDELLGESPERASRWHESPSDDPDAGAQRAGDQRRPDHAGTPVVARPGARSRRGALAGRESVTIIQIATPMSPPTAPSTICPTTVDIARYDGVLCAHCCTAESVTTRAATAARSIPSSTSVVDGRRGRAGMSSTRCATSIARRRVTRAAGVRDGTASPPASRRAASTCS